MPPKRKTKRSKLERERRRPRRTRPRAQELVPLKVPDLRHPRMRAELRREGELLALHPENAEIDAWIDVAYDWSEWPEWSEETALTASTAARGRADGGRP